MREKRNKRRLRAIALGLCISILLVLAGCGEQSVETGAPGSGSGSVAGTDTETVTGTYISDQFYFHLTDEEYLAEEGGVAFANNELLLIPAASVTRADLEAAIAPYGGSVIGYSDLTNEYQIQFTQTYDLAQLQALQDTLEQKGLFDSVQINYALELQADFYPDDELWASEWSQQPGDGNWGMEAIQAPAAWDSYDTLSPVNVGLIDNWFFVGHGDLHFAGTYFNTVWSADSAHGTHTSGTIGAKFNNGEGVAGVMPKANLYGFSTDGTGKATTLAVFNAGLRQLIGEADCKVVNVSMGLTCDFAAAHGNQNAQAAINSVNASIERTLLSLLHSGHEFVIVKSAGNENDRISPSESYRYFRDSAAYFGYVQDPNGTEYGDTDAAFGMFSGITNPEIESRILVVGAVELDKTTGEIRMAPYSNHGKRVDLAAPGSAIESTYATMNVFFQFKEDYIERNGTSMAAPHVAGAAAMLFGADDALTGADVKAILCDTASGSYGYADSTFSETYPLLNVKAALDAVTSGSYVGTQLQDFTLPDEMVIAIGETNVIEPTVQPEDAGTYQMTWTSSDDSIATVAPGGIVYGASKGTVEITATAVCAGKTVTRTTQLRVASQARDTVLVLDISGSMSGGPMEEMKKAATQFCTDLLEDPYSNRVGLVCYDDSIVDYALTSDLDTLVDAIAALEPGGTTNMHGGLERAKDIMENQSKDDAIRNIVVMADGLPNEGAYSASGSFATGGNSWMSFGYGYENAVVDIGQEIMKSYNLYSLGFFHQLSGTSKETAVNLMEMLTNQTDGYHEVVEAENLQFAFGEIAEDIDSGERIVINIACPVDVFISYNGETLSSASSSYQDTASFGSLKLLGKKKDIKVVTLDADKVYDVQLTGTDDGAMDYTINYIDDTDTITDYRGFRSVPITASTRITTSTDNSKAVQLNIDENGDGTIDSIWSANQNEIGNRITQQADVEPTEPKTELSQDTQTLSAGIVVLICLVVLLVVGVLVGVAVACGASAGNKGKKTVPISAPPAPVDLPPAEKELPNDADTAPLAAAGPCVTVLSGPLSGRHFFLPRDGVVYIGKAKQAGVRLPVAYEKVSRLHCSVQYQADLNRYFVVDCSSNGTYLSAHNRLQRGKRTAIAPGTELFLADEGCRIRLENL